MTVHYFAYASNMSLAQMRERCPESMKVGIGQLPGHRLVFPRFSKNRQCGVASVEPHAPSTVWGVVFHLTAEDALRLDRFEGHVPDRHPTLNNYNRTVVPVHAEGLQTGPMDCMTYVATVQGEHFAPSADYHGLILRGARENGLPPHYLDFLSGLFRQYDPAG